MTRRLSSVPVVVVLLLGLVACDSLSEPAPTADSQSVASACGEVSEAVADAVAALGQVDPADPAAAADAIAEVGERLHTASDSVTNSDVAALLPGMQDDLAAIGAALVAIAGGDLSQSAALAAPIASMQKSFSRFRELCDPS
ncbi:hypothetical protein [Microbacterium invictum]|uniref:Glycosyltransferase involved in cell wall biosynthesis n=1 Tax=Microbacterium invictum TaxID=515415 RepID=A0AA40SP79_9MICO|nr:MULTISPECIES: hypothetical protein [Microbacterium]MBB4139888.1 glycosyltransferase involved in cell wall biosynthesis [Microbacterium invictum]